MAFKRIKEGVNSEITKYRTLFKAIPPMSTIEIEKRKMTIQQKVDKYTPLIEEKIGVTLGEIILLDNKSAGLRTVKLLSKAIKESYKEISKDSNNIIEYLVTMGFYTIINLVMLPHALLMNYSNCSSYSATPINKKNCITFPIDIIERIDILENPEKIDDATIVHELFHIAWARLGGTLDLTHVKNTKAFLNWIEGFAVYCTLDLSNELNNNWKQPFFGSYEKGQILMDWAVEKYGKEIINQIPLSWEHLDAWYNIDEDMNK
ncbi:MAG: hypothetical protein WC356_05790 [Candidatus Micrarchaeia archaeon]|jgi:hypothetical protein